MTQRPCLNCDWASHSTWCSHCGSFTPHGAVRSAEPEADTQLLVGLFWAFVLLVVAALVIWTLYVLVFTIGALGP